MKQTFRLGRGPGRLGRGLGRLGRGPAGDRIRAARILRWLAIVLAALTALYLAVNWPRLQQGAQMATGFGARMACSCRYIQGRDLPSCQSDFRGMEGMGLVRLRDDSEAKVVRASIPLMASRAATFKPGFGCLPDKG